MHSCVGGADVYNSSHESGGIGEEGEGCRGIWCRRKLHRYHMPTRKLKTLVLTARNL